MEILFCLYSYNVAFLTLCFLYVYSIFMSKTGSWGRKSGWNLTVFGKRLRRGVFLTKNLYEPDPQTACSICEVSLSQTREVFSQGFGYFEGTFHAEYSRRGRISHGVTESIADQVCSECWPSISRYKNAGGFFTHRPRRDLASAFFGIPWRIERIRQVIEGETFTEGWAIVRPRPRRGPTINRSADIFFLICRP